MILTRLFRNRPARGIAVAAAAGVLSAGMAVSPAAALEKVTYLIAAPLVLPAYAPWVLAKSLGYYKDAGYDVSFVTAHGGVDVAKQVGVGNAPMGNAIGDTPIIVRANGVPVKVVAVMGGGALTVLVGRTDRGIHTLADFKGKKISTLSYTDTTYYAMLGTLASAGVKKSEIEAEGVGPANVAGFVVSGKVDACACTPDWEVDVENGLPGKTVAFPTQNYFPSMAQAILASDAVIKSRPELVRGIVQATIKAMKYIMADPHEAAKDYVAVSPAYNGKEKLVEQIMKRYIEREYAGQKIAGAMNPDRLAKLQGYYLQQGVIRKKTPIDELYTNQFVQ